VLADLAGAFAVPAAGLAALPEGRPVQRHGPGVAVLPWADQPNLLSPGRQGPTAPVFPLAAGSLLLTALRPPPGAAWPLSPAAALPGARRPRPSGPRAGWAPNARAPPGGEGGRPQRRGAPRQQALESAAAVVRRLAHDYGNVLTGILGFCELSLAQPMPASSHL